MNGFKTDTDNFESRIALLEESFEKVQRESIVSGHGKIIGHGKRLEVDKSMRLTDIDSRITNVEKGIASIGSYWKRNSDSGYIYPDTISDDVIIGSGNKPVSMFELWKNNDHPILTITAAHDTDYDPQIQFRRDATPTVKFSMGVDLDDATYKFKIYPGAGIGGTTDFVIDSSGLTLGKSLAMSAHVATLTHTGTTSLTIASTSGTVIIESVTFTGANVTGIGTLSCETIIIEKTSGFGIKVDTAAPTFGWRDLLGEPTTKNTGATKPSYEAYNGPIDGFRYSDGDEEQHEYHIPHDYVPGSDIYLHIHWSQISTTNTGGTIDFKYSSVYSKGHNQAAFTSTPITDTITSDDAGVTQYQHHITEQIISGASATAALFDRDDIEPDGVILLTLEMDTNNLTDSVAVTDPFIHFVDIHYQSTNIATKNKVPNFYT